MVSRSELAARLSRDGASHAQAAHAVDAVLHEITAALVAGERVALTGFGTFEPVARPARTARNPRTGSAVAVPAATVARFRPGAKLRGALQSGDAGAGPGGRLPVLGRVGAPAPLSDATAESGPEAEPSLKSEPKSEPKSKSKATKHAGDAKPAKGKKGKAATTVKASSSSGKGRGGKKSSKGKH